MIRGWCPSLFEPMASGDGMLVRVKPRAGGMDADVLRAVAEAAARFGNGTVNLTGRANLQLRGLSEASLAGFAEAVLARGAADADPATERRRNVVVSPLAGDDPGAAPETLAVARALEAALAARGHSAGGGRTDADGRDQDGVGGSDAEEARGRAALDGLPGKFGFAVDGGGVLGIGVVRADVMLRCADGLCTVRLDGGGAGLAVRPERAASVAVSLAAGFVALSGTAEHARSGRAVRMRDVVAALGEAAVVAAAGLSTQDVRPAPAATRLGDQRSREWGLQDHGAEDRGAEDRGAEDRGAEDRDTQDRGAQDWSTRNWHDQDGRAAWPDGRGVATGGAGPAVGAIRYAGLERGAFAAAPAFGQVEAAALHALAGLAERYGDGRVRLSPWRTLLVGGVAARDLERLGEACGALGLIVAAGDPRLSVVTCPGWPGCGSGEADTRGDAPALAALVGPGWAGGVVHLSGCAKGCAHPGPAGLTLVGRAGGYGVVRDGQASDAPGQHLASVGEAGAWLREGWAGGGILAPCADGAVA